MSKKAEGFNLKNPYNDPTKAQMRRVPELVPVKRERIEITQPVFGRGGAYLKQKVLQRITYASGVVKSGLFPGEPMSRTISAKNAQAGTVVTELGA